MNTAIYVLSYASWLNILDSKFFRYYCNTTENVSKGYPMFSDDYRTPIGKSFLLAHDQRVFTTL
jgi:hypothetical protein